MTAPEVVVVTGASSGIGRAVALAYAARGAAVVLGGRHADRLAEVQAAIGAPARVAIVAGDVADEATARALVVTARERFGRLDHVVNSAGVFAAKPFVDYAIDELDTFVATNLRGTILVAREAVRTWRATGSRGSIVNVSAAIAIAPQLGIPASFPVAIKAAVNGLTKALALELAAEQIRVNAVAPGIIRTPLLRGDPDALRGAQPVGRIGEADDVARAVLYLADAPFVTGVVLPVDGGMTAGRF